MMLAGEVAWAVGADLQELPCFCQSRTQGHIQAEYCDCALTSVVYPYRRWPYRKLISIDKLLGTLLEEPPSDLMEAEVSYECVIAASEHHDVYVRMT